ncbi:hypothetical protein [Microbulbifer thermotolerans]|uniref:hypothetical protein n=1 Tax=Microbulbifer thermotolerans TaxID=252514 RepID=UPI002248E271|nr:hypothetical protein [Microbulbifer thermotolerans]MCX2830317.1 hypothetical protein [Microbulbifer thermotolerans]
MADRAYQLLRKATIRWRGTSLQPYFWLLAGAISVSLLQWPNWIPPALLGVILLALFLDRNWRISSTEICRRLDSHFTALQDSSALLEQAPEHLSPLAQLQRLRTATALQQLLDSGALKNFRPAWHRSAVINAAGACLGLLLAAAFTGLPERKASSAAGARTDAVPPSAIAVVEAVTEIRPPAYTKLPLLTQSLEVHAPEQSSVTWRITLNQPTDSLAMLAAKTRFDFTATEPLPSRHWQLTRTMAASDFYQLSARLGAEETLLPEIHNIEIQSDQPPEFSFSLPRDNILVADNSALPRLQVDVTVRDDFQVAGTELLITLASGDGENVRFRNDTIALEPVHAEGGATRYRFTLPLDRYTVEPGDELYWFLQARDNREPEPNLSKSQHFIVRWPQEEIFGLSDAEGMAIKVLPEYFRSQRQLIIDTEALIAERQQLSEAEFRKRSQSLAYEQNLLRMRYGRFLGEEDSEQEHSDGDAAHGDDHEAHGDAHESHEEHEEGHPPSPQQFGDASGVVAAAGHQHDSSEHATLFDPQTKELLRSALNAMWSSHRELSVIDPQASLPHQHRALRYIKEVQQASRIYLQRVGFEPPPLDEERRLSGEREDVKPPPLSAQRSAPEREQLEQLLHQVRAGDTLDSDGVEALLSLTQVREQPQLKLELSKNLRLYQQRTNCSDCRRQLSALLYQLLPAPQALPSLPRERAAAGSFDHWLRQQNGGRE